MGEWVAYYKQYKALILFIAAWLHSIPTGIFVSRLDTFLKNRSKESKIKEIFTRYAEVVRRRTEIYPRNGSPVYKFEWGATKMLLLTIVIMNVQMFSHNAFADVFGENA